MSTAVSDVESKRSPPPESPEVGGKSGTASGRTSPEGSSSREVSEERQRTTPASSVTGRTKSGTVNDSEEEEELANSEEGEEVAVAVPDLELHQTGGGNYETVMRCRSPGYSDESCEEDGTPNSISLSVSEVQTSVFNEVRLGDLTRLHHDTAERGRLIWQATGNKMVIEQPANVKEEEDRFNSERKGPKRGMDKVKKPNGKSTIRGSNRIPPRPILKIIVTKPEVKDEEPGDEPLVTEDVNTVLTRERGETPRIPLFPQGIVDRGEAVITQSCRGNEESTEEDDEADYGGSDGGDMRMLARPKHTSVVYLMKPKKPMIAGESMGDRGRIKRGKPRRLVRTRDKNSPERRKRKRTEIQKDINRRNEKANKRQRSIKGIKQSIPFCETKSREVSLKEMQAEKRAIEQEINASRTGGISIVGPVKFPLGPLPWGKGRKKIPKNTTREAASSSGGPALGGRPPELSLPSPREADIIDLAPKVELVTKTQKNREKEPVPRITDGDIGVSGGH